MAKSFDEVMQEVLAEESEYQTWDHEFTANPHSPWRAAKDLALVEWVPQLIGALEGSDGARSKWALYAIELLGPRAGSAAAAALERRNEGEVLFRVDPDRARAIGVDGDRRWRSKIAETIVRSGDDAAAARHLAHLLESADPEVLAFALGSEAYSDSSHMDDVARRSPELMPMEAIRTLVEHGDERVRTGAVRTLAAMHLPGDTERVIDAVASGRATVIAIVAEWLGSHPQSHRLAARLSTREAFEVARRRRCAGLYTDREAFRGVFRAAFNAPPAGRGMNDDRWRQQAIGNAARGCAELADESMLLPIVDAVGPDGPFDELLIALRPFGEAAKRRVAEALERDGGARKERLGWMREALQRPLTAWPTLHDAGERFAEGNIEDSLLVDNAAFGAYATLLQRHPACAQAAFQLAWIDRAYGSVITPERVEWLRDLGVRDHLLGELARPMAPADVLPGFRGSNHRLADHDPRLAARAERAGLCGMAANWWKKDPARAALAKDAARAHLERVARGCPDGGAP